MNEWINTDIYTYIISDCYSVMKKIGYGKVGGSMCIFVWVLRDRNFSRMVREVAFLKKRYLSIFWGKWRTARYLWEKHSRSSEQVQGHRQEQRGSLTPRLVMRWILLWLRKWLQEMCDPFIFKTLIPAVVISSATLTYSSFATASLGPSLLFC